MLSRQLNPNSLTISSKHQFLYSPPPLTQICSINFLKKPNKNSLNTVCFSKFPPLLPIISHKDSKNSIFPLSCSLKLESFYDRVKFRENAPLICNLYERFVVNIGPLCKFLSKKIVSLLVLGVLSGMALTISVSGVSGMRERCMSNRGLAFACLDWKIYALYYIYYRNSEPAKFPDRSKLTEEDIKFWKSFKCAIVAGMMAIGLLVFQEGTAVVLQVGFVDNDRELRRKLKAIDHMDDSRCLKEVTKALLQHYDSCHFAYAFEEHNHCMQLLVSPSYLKALTRERARYAKIFRKESVVNSTTAIGKANLDNTFTVVTILVLARGEVPICPRKIDEAMKTLHSIPTDNIQAMQVLWGPQCDGETMSEQQLRRNFPLLEPRFDLLLHKGLKNLVHLVFGFDL